MNDCFLTSLSQAKRTPSIGGFVPFSRLTGQANLQLSSLLLAVLGLAITAITPIFSNGEQLGRGKASYRH